MFLLLVLLFTFGYILGYFFGNVENYGVSKTVGWAYNISNNVVLTSIIFFCSQILFILTYFILFLLKRKTNYYVSLAHFEIIIVTLYLMSSEKFTAALIISLISLIALFVNIFKSKKEN